MEQLLLLGILMVSLSLSVTSCKKEQSYKQQKFAESQLVISPITPIKCKSTSTRNTYDFVVDVTEYISIENMSEILAKSTIPDSKYARPGLLGEYVMVKQKNGKKYNITVTMWKNNWSLDENKNYQDIVSLKDISNLDEIIIVFGIDGEREFDGKCFSLMIYKSGDYGHCQDFPYEEEHIYWHWKKEEWPDVERALKFLVGTINSN